MATELELLQQIVNNTQGDDSANIAFISAGAALIGASIGAIISYLGLRINREVETRKLKAGLIATERLRWLQDIRQRFSRFSSDLDMQYNLIKRPVKPEERDVFQVTLDTYSKAVSEQCNVIILMLNPSKKHQKDLRDAINEALAFFIDCINKKTEVINEIDDKKYVLIKTRAFNALTIIGVETWGQVKDLE